MNFTQNHFGVRGFSFTLYSYWQGQSVFLSHISNNPFFGRVGLVRTNTARSSAHDVALVSRRNRSSVSPPRQRTGSCRPEAAGGPPVPRGRCHPAVGRRPDETGATPWWRDPPSPRVSPRCRAGWQWIDNV